MQRTSGVFKGKELLIMIQDIYPHKLNNQYDLKAVPSPNSPVLVFDGPKVLADTNGWLRIPSAEEVGMD